MLTYPLPQGLLDQLGGGKGPRDPSYRARCEFGAEWQGSRCKCLQNGSIKLSKLCQRPQNVGEVVGFQGLLGSPVTDVLLHELHRLGSADPLLSESCEELLRIQLGYSFRPDLFPRASKHRGSGCSGSHGKLGELEGSVRRSSESS